MYVPLRYRPDSHTAIENIFEAYPFATLTSILHNRLVATHTPLIYQKDAKSLGNLHGHIARANKQVKCLEEGQGMLAIFHGPHTYISSSWYEKTNVPTWNYISVHVYGKARVLSEMELLAFLEELVERNEGHRSNRFKVADMPEDMLLSQMKGIVGFVMQIEDVEASFKLSQNRNDRDFKNIILELEKRGDHFSFLVAESMKKIRPQISDVP